MNFKKWIYLAIFLGIFYFIFIANFFITLTIIFSLVIAFKLYKWYARKKLNKLIRSKEIFRESELGLFIALVAKVAKADGRVQELEAQLIGMMFDDICKIFDEQQKARTIMKEVFNEAKEKDDDTKRVAQALNIALGNSRIKRRHYIEFLVQLAFIDSGISSDEDKVLREIIYALNISQSEYEAIISKFENMKQGKSESMDIKQAYEILGVKESDDMATIKKAYRNLIRKYHPDIISSQDKDDSYIEEATKKTQEINQAYQVIKEARK